MILKWSRVKARAQLSALQPRIYEIDDDLKSCERAAKEYINKWHLEEPFLFHPDDYAGMKEQLTPGNMAISQEELLEFAKTATAIRERFATTAKNLYS